MSLEPTPAERDEIEAVRAAVLACIRADVPIPFSPPTRDPRPETRDPIPSPQPPAPSPFSGRIGPFRYQFEGEEDLLHLFVVRHDGAPLTPEEAQSVASLVLPDVPPGLLWFKPGHLSQHFYLGHDVLLDSQSV